jgi:hypothetical protein
MIEQTFPLQIPPGLVRVGTLQEKTGRWINQNYVRFNEAGFPEPMPGTSSVSLIGTPPSGGQGTAAYHWFDVDGGNLTVVVGKKSKVYSFTSVGLNVNDITPAGISDAGSFSTWAFSNLGNVLLFTRAFGAGSSTVIGGSLWAWDPDVGGPAITALSSSTVHGVVVTPERYVVVIDDDHTIRWASQGTYDEFEPNSTNSAGDLDIPTKGQLIRLLMVRGETVILGSQDAWVMDYVGGDLIYGARNIGDQCGLLGPNAVAVMGTTAYWMGQRGFFQYDGFVRPLECPIASTIFSGTAWTNSLASGRVFALSVPTHNEIWWFHNPTSDSAPTQRIRYNTETHVWYDEPITASCGIDAVWPLASGGSNIRMAPMLFNSDGNAPVLHDASGVMSGAFIESGPIFLGEGDQLMRVQKVIPDGARTGDDITLYAGTWPDVAETSVALAPLTAGGPLNVRFSARYIRYKQSLETIPSRVGVPKLGVLPGSRR